MPDFHHQPFVIALSFARFVVPPPFFWKISEGTRDLGLGFEIWICTFLKEINKNRVITVKTNPEIAGRTNAYQIMYKISF